MTNLPAWVATRSASAPAALRERMHRALASGAETATPTESWVLARAGQQLLETVLAGAGQRSVAVDLLAADGLITLALLHCAEAEPAALGAFARALTARNAE